MSFYCGSGRRTDERNRTCGSHADLSVHSRLDSDDKELCGELSTGPTGQFVISSSEDLFLHPTTYRLVYYVRVSHPEGISALPNTSDCRCSSSHIIADVILHHSDYPSRLTHTAPAYSDQSGSVRIGTARSRLVPLSTVYVGGTSVNVLPHHVGLRDGMGNVVYCYAVKNWSVSRSGYVIKFSGVRFSSIHFSIDVALPCTSINASSVSCFMVLRLSLEEKSSSSIRL